MRIFRWLAAFALIMGFAFLEAWYVRPVGADTVYLCVVDKDRNCVSLIQSNYNGFGSGLVPDDLGFAMQNRGTLFALDPGHPNRLEPHKRPFHTIIPAMVFKDGLPWLVFGVMGGDMQAQGHVQMIVRLADHRQNPQTAADAPRWKVLGGREVIVEHHMPEAAVEGLAQLGHQVRRLERWNTQFGSAQLIYRLEGGYFAASEPRRDGQAVGF